MDKYEVLYNLSLDIYKERQEAIQHLQDKSSKYFTALTFIMGFAIYYLKWFFEQIKLPFMFYDYIIIFESTILLLALCVTWFTLISIISVENYKALPLDDELLKFFIDNKQIDIYYTMSKGIKEVVEINNKNFDKKSNLLFVSYNLLKLDAILIIISLVLFIIKYLTNNG